MTVKSMFRFGVAWMYCWVMAHSVVHAQEARSEPSNSAGITVAQLKERAAELRRSGASAADQSALYAAWMDTHNWQQISLWELRELYDGLDLDHVDIREFSVRWTGYLTAPVSGRYTFRQVRQLHQDAVMRVWIDGRLVLDSGRPALEDQSARFQSEPVALRRGEAVPLRVDYVQDINFAIEYSRGAPIAALAWESAITNLELIPTTAYSPSETMATAGTKGLRAEYFASTSFDAGHRKADQLDSAIEMVWPWKPVVPVYKERLATLREVAWAKMGDDDFLSSISPADRKPFVERAAWQLCHRLPLTKRRTYVQKLMGQPSLLEAMSPYAMGKLFECVYMLPTKEHLELLGRWAEARPQPRHRMGIIPGWGEGHYARYNLEYYWLIGNFLEGPYWPDTEILLDKYLRRSNGECNLAIAYAASYSAQAAGKGDLLLEHIRARGEDASIGGDHRMTWLLAEAYADGALVYGDPRPNRGMNHLEEASLVAESDEYCFWALQEMVARYASLNQGARAKALIDQYADRFPGPEYQAQMSQWRAETDELAAIYAERSKQVDDSAPTWPSSKSD